MEIVHQVDEVVGGIDELLSEEPDAGLISDRLVRGIGTSQNRPATAEETAWAARRLFQVLARRQALVLLFEDLHWAEPGLLDMIEHVADRAVDAPILLLCLARPQLLDDRISWGAGRRNAVTSWLDPLSSADSDALLDGLSTNPGLTAQTRARVKAVAEGNPLFLEQSAAMLAETGHTADLVVPPTIQALLLARLERLGPGERAVVECASIGGRDFWHGSVAALLPEGAREATARHLSALARKELIRPDRSSLLGHDAFRFRHVLIQVAAYRSIPKRARAELHERFAGWLEHVTEERAGEFEEILGYHLEQAYRYRFELGLVDEKALGLANSAHRRLLSAGRLAFRRGDMQAAINLLERARSLPSSDERPWLDLAPDLGLALFHAGELERAETVLSDTIERARDIREPRTERHAWLVRAQLRQYSSPERIDYVQSLREAEESLAVFHEAADDLALTRAWNFLWELYQCTGKASSLRHAAEQGLEHARRAAVPSTRPGASRASATHCSTGPRRSTRVFRSARACWPSCRATRCGRRWCAPSSPRSSRCRAVSRKRES